MDIKIKILVLIITLPVMVFAQQTPMDWTKNDCRHNQSFNLFSQLDSGYVIVQEYVMLGCWPCNASGDQLKNILQPFETSHPGRIKFFQTAYDDATTCSGLVHWADTSGYANTTLFDKGGTEWQYYDHGAMPVIVVMGSGTAHKVHYNVLGYPPLDSMAISHAIHMALLPVDVPDISKKMLFTVSPNPVLKNVSIRYDKLIASCTITSLTGQVIYKNTYSSSQLNPVIDLSGIAPGLYFVKIIDVDGNVGVQKVVKE